MDPNEAQQERTRIRMDEVCFALPVLSGKARVVRCFFRALETERYAEYAFSQQLRGITKEAWYLQSTPLGDLLLSCMESPDLESALSRLWRSGEEFDVWFKRRLADVTSVDLGNPAQWTWSEQLSSYEAYSLTGGEAMKSPLVYPDALSGRTVAGL